MKWSWFVHLGHLQLQLVENYIHTTEGWQLHRNRHASHRLELAFALPQIFGPKPFNKSLNKQNIIIINLKIFLTIFIYKVLVSLLMILFGYNFKRFIVNINIPKCCFHNKDFIMFMYVFRIQQLFLTILHK